MIPVIDVADAVAGSPSEDTVAAIRSAAEEVGFFQVVGHGVGPEVIDDVYLGAETLMSLPEDVKSQWMHPHPFRGWERRPAAGSIVIAQRLQVCNIDSEADALARGIDPALCDYFHSNVWPDVPDLQRAIRTMMDATKQVGEVLMSLFALALDLPGTYFQSAFDNQVSSFAINHYEGGRAAGPDNELALREHKDSGTLTVLHQRGAYEGLQLRLVDGSLMTIPVREDAFVINIGELMEHWTNDQFKATLHRVLLPEVVGRKRTSLTLFQGPAIDTVIAPLASCVGDGRPKYDPVTPYDWEARYFSQNNLAYGVPYEMNA
jgi:isopenicillin N synthase-like dioxygenase